MIQPLMLVLRHSCVTHLNEVSVTQVASQYFHLAISTIPTKIWRYRVCV